MARPKGILSNDELIDLVCDMLARRWAKSKIKKAVRSHAVKLDLIQDEEDVSAQILEQLVARARDTLTNRITQVKSEAFGRSIAFYESMIASTVSTPRDKIRAQERLDKLLALEPQFQAPGGDDLDALRASLAVEPVLAVPPDPESA